MEAEIDGLHGLLKLKLREEIGADVESVQY
jgi:hypothetical protein